MRLLFLLCLILLALSIIAKTPYFNENSLIVQLNQLNFDEETNGFIDKSWVVFFYAPWCPHCKDIQSVYEELSVKLKGKLTFAQIDRQNIYDKIISKLNVFYKKSEQNIQIKDRFGVNSFPTIFLVSHETKQIHKFMGQRTLENIEEFFTKTFKEFPGKDIPSRPSLFTTLKNYYTQIGSVKIIFQIITLNQSGIILTGLLLFVSLVDVPIITIKDVLFNIFQGKDNSLQTEQQYIQEKDNLQKTENKLLGDKDKIQNVQQQNQKKSKLQ